MLDVLLPVVLLAALISALRQAPRYFQKQTRRSLSISTGRLAPRADWALERHGLTLSATTASLNTLPKRIVSCLQPRQRTAALRFYDAGVLVGCTGSIVALSGAVWALTRAWLAVWDEAEEHARVTVKPGKILRRAVEAVREVKEVQSGDGGLQPLIPGVTTPLRHLPTLILALVLAQLVHELGHAIAAALDDVSPSKLAFSVHAILPSASVVFPSNVDFLPVRSRARIATSGPWHNLLFWMALMPLSGLSSLVWADYAAEGRVVMQVSNPSLHKSLKAGDVITHLDDTFVGGTAPQDAWTRYLTDDRPPSWRRGWCLSEKEFTSAPTAPCSEHHLVGFITGENDDTMIRCLAPHGIMATPSTDCKCSARDVCVRPAPAEQIMRIGLRSGQTILWSGDRSAVLSQVHVGTQRPRIFADLTRWGALFISYLKMISLSLFLFNLLPLPGTDGIHLFSALVSNTHGHTRASRQLTAQPASRHPTINPYRYDSDSDSDEYGEQPNWATGHGRREQIWQRRLRRVLEGGTAAVVAGWVLGWAMLALLRSS